ncbi:hypothetical protein FQN49_000763 [Arthroderma sp. PD_2]|nr:hypothetical protein FQN49_000763 [Arthroderma sp. PD_2]
MASQAPATGMATSKPCIFLLSLETESFFEEIYKKLLDGLLSKAKVQRATKPAPTIKYLSENTPNATLITDPSITETRYSAVLEKVITYARNGGTVIFGGLFSTFVTPDRLDRFFDFSWGIPWKYGDYHRTTVYVNVHCQGMETKGLPASYSQKAVFLKNVSPECAVYSPTKNSVTESLVFASQPVGDLSQKPVVFAAYGQGWVGYVGDVNGEEGSHAAVLAMCKL